MTWKTYTMKPAHLVTTIFVIALAVVDLALVCFTGTGSSVSNFLVNVSFLSPTVVLGIGFICGHIFGPMRKAALCEKCKRDVEET